MGVPRQAQERGDAADKLLKDQIGAGKTKLDEDGKPLVKAPEDDKGVHAGYEPIPDKDKPIDPDRPVAPEGFEQKYKVLRGKYDSEVKPLQEKVKGLEARTVELTNLLAMINTKGAQAEPKPAPKPREPEAPVKAEDFMSAEELEGFTKVGYDPKDLDILATLASRIALKNVSSVANSVNRLSKTVNVSKKETFWAALERSVENRLAIEEEPGFKAFIITKAPYLNATRQQVLEEAAKRQDLNTVVEVYNSYLATKETPKAEPKPKPKPGLKAELEPDVGAATPTPAEGKIWTPDEISKFYSDVTKGVYRGREDEAERLDKDILLAPSQGRVKR